MSQEGQKLNQQFDLEELKMYPSNRRRQEEIFDNFYQRCVDKKKAPYLSDLIIEGDSWGCIPLIIIATNEIERASLGGQLLQFKIKVRCDKWGNPVKPGDFVTHFVPTKAWRGASPKEESRARQMGKYNDLYKKALQYKVDSKGCIEVPFHTASILLQQYGVHHGSQAPITTRDKVLPGQVPIKKGSKEMGTIHYWRFEEVTDKQYEQLPFLNQQKAQQSK